MRWHTCAGGACKAEGLAGRQDRGGKEARQGCLRNAQTDAWPHPLQGLFCSLRWGVPFSGNTRKEPDERLRTVGRDPWAEMLAVTCCRHAQNSHTCTALHNPKVSLQWRFGTEHQARGPADSFPTALGSPSAGEGRHPSYLPTGVRSTLWREPGVGHCHPG